MGRQLLRQTLFFRVQSMGLHHRYLVTPTILVFACVGVLFSDGMGGKALENVGQLYDGSGAHTVYREFGNCVQPFGGEHAGEFFRPNQYPKRAAENGISSALRQIAADLRTLTEGTGKTVYVCGDGSEFSQELLRKSLMPEERKLYRLCWPIRSSICGTVFQIQLF